MDRCSWKATISLDGLSLGQATRKLKSVQVPRKANCQHERDVISAGWDVVDSDGIIEHKTARGKPNVWTVESVITVLEELTRQGAPDNAHLDAYWPSRGRPTLHVYWDTVGEPGSGFKTKELAF